MAIKDVLYSIREYLSYKLADGMNVVLNSVSKDKRTEQEDVVITLLRIEEETSRKPQGVYYTSVEDVKYPTSPDININLELLISAQTPKYDSALTLISDVVSIMNSIKTAPKPAKMTQESFERIKSLNISMMNISFEQNLSMWQTLGGNLVPAVAYKLRMLTLSGIPDTTAGIPVRKVVIESDNTNKMMQTD